MHLSNSPYFELMPSFSTPNIPCILHYLIDVTSDLCTVIRLCLHTYRIFLLITSNIELFLSSYFVNADGTRISVVSFAVGYRTKNAANQQKELNGLHLQRYQCDIRFPFIEVMNVLSDQTFMYPDRMISKGSPYDPKIIIN